ncbi:MAG: DUF1801 domain-containing protein [Paracoccaceae bacterium]
MRYDTVDAFIDQQVPEDRVVCEILRDMINAGLPEAESKIWHAHPVWFLDGNPVTGFSRLKAGIRLMFWSGAGFDEVELRPGTGKFMDASIIYTSVGQINAGDIGRWPQKAKQIQWDYKNIIRNRRLERLN